MVRPMRLPKPSGSVKRYQYTRLGLRPPTSTRQVQSEAADTGAVAVATTRVNDSSSAASTFKVTGSGSPGFSPMGGRRVHSSTLLLSGSPDATPSGNRSRRSCHAMRDIVPNGLPQAAVAPVAAAIARKERRVMADIGSHPPCRGAHSQAYAKRKVVLVRLSCQRKGSGPGGVLSGPGARILRLMSAGKNNCRAGGTTGKD